MTKRTTVLWMKYITLIAYILCAPYALRSFYSIEVILRSWIILLSLVQQGEWVLGGGMICEIVFLVFFLQRREGSSLLQWGRGVYVWCLAELKQARSNRLPLWIREKNMVREWIQGGKKSTVCSLKTERIVEQSAPLNTFSIYLARLLSSVLTNVNVFAFQKLWMISLHSKPYLASFSYKEAG